MTKYLLVAMLFLTGCASPIVYNDQNKYSSVSRLEKINTPVETLPRLPQLVIEPVNGVQKATLDLAGVNALREYRATAEQHEEALTQAIKSYNVIVDRDNVMLTTLKMEEERANATRRQLQDTENLRVSQQRESRLDLLVHKLVIIILGVAIVL